jgi:hypothetical protein
MFPIHTSHALPGIVSIAQEGMRPNIGSQGVIELFWNFKCS